MDVMLLLVLGVKIFLEVRIGFVTDLYMTYVQRVHNLLDGLWFASWCGRERHDAEVWIMLHHETYDLRVRIVTSPSVSLVCPKQLTSINPDIPIGLATNL